MNEQQYYQQFIEFMRDLPSLRPEFTVTNAYPILNEDTAITNFDPHYIYHVAWALKKVRQLGPELHVDFSSSLNFCTVLPAICKTKFYDFRPASIFIEDLYCDSCDLSSSSFDVGKYSSVSCMHVIEHIGLGRYGDSLDVNGDLKAIHNLKKAVAPGGSLLFVVPCGRPSIYFNAHRVYSAQSIHDYFSDSFDLLEFYFIPGPTEEPPQLNPNFESTLRYPYGCGCFYFRSKT